MPDPTTAFDSDAFNAFRTVCAYARNYIDEYGDRAEVDELERLIASLSRRLASPGPTAPSIPPAFPTDA